MHAALQVRDHRLIAQHKLETVDELLACDFVNSLAAGVQLRLKDASAARGRLKIELASGAVFQQVRGDIELLQNSLLEQMNLEKKK